MAQDSKSVVSTIRPGSRIELPRPGGVFGWLKRRLPLVQLVRGVNAFLNMEVRSDPKATAPAFIVSDTNAMLILPSGAGSGSGGSATINMFKFVSDGGNYLLCHTWDGTTEGTTLVPVAKPYELRVSGSTAWTGGTIRSVAYTVSYANSGSYWTRTVSGSDGTSTTEVVIPDYLSGFIIFAMQSTTGLTYNNQPVTWQDINAGGRAWTAQ